MRDLLLFFDLFEVSHQVQLAVIHAEGNAAVRGRVLAGKIEFFLRTLVSLNFVLDVLIRGLKLVEVEDRLIEVVLDREGVLEEGLLFFLLADLYLILNFKYFPQQIDALLLNFLLFDVFRGVLHEFLHFIGELEELLGLFPKAGLGVVLAVYCCRFLRVNLGELHF